MKRICVTLLAVFALAVMVAQAADAARSTGWISDSKCGAMHTGSGADCVQTCIKSGQKPVFVDSKKEVWAIDNPNVVKPEFYGAHVTVKATEDAANKSVHIDSIRAVK